MLCITRTRTLAPIREVFRAASTWSNVPAGPPDPILGMSMFIARGHSECLGLYVDYGLVRRDRSFQGRQGPEKNQPWCWCLPGR